MTTSRFFDGEAFADNPVWASCYCFPISTAAQSEEFDERTGEQNRADKAALIERGEATGVLAYAGERVVGWCHAAPRDWLPALDRTPEFASTATIVSARAAIVCFVIAPRYRGQGLARRLLDGACDLHARSRHALAGRLPAASPRRSGGSYHGRLSMYVDAGFERVRDAGRFAVVRKTL